MVKNTKIVTRREFIRAIPAYFVNTLQSFTKELYEPPSAETEAVVKEHTGQRKIAKLNLEDCLAWNGTSCQFCYLACPLRDQAITMQDQKPVIDPFVCDGCAKCVTACQTVNTTPAITTVALHSSSV